MKKFFESLYLNKYFLTFIVVFAYLESIQVRFYFVKSLEWYLFTPEAAIAQLFNALFLFVIIGLVISRFNDKFSLPQAIAIFFISLVLYLIGNNLLSYLIALSFDTVERNFNLTSFSSSNIKYGIDVFVYGGFFLAHYYFQKYQEDKAKLAKLEKAQMQSQLTQLKAQLDPHFLFNNLNLLDQLIEEDQSQASAFLHDFSDIYRYVLKSSDQELVRLEDELAFEKRYFRLMKQKYGDAYRFKVTGAITDNALLPALSLQLLLENSFEHNLGTAQSPVDIELQIKDKSIRLTNTLKPNKNPKTEGGRALQNLRLQFELLGKANLSIETSERTFEVELPLLFENEH